MPWRDWQFWVVTLVAVWGLWAVIRQLLPSRDDSEQACSTCALSSAAQAGKDPSVGETQDSRSADN